MKQYEAVIQAMRENGGYATLGQLYQLVLQIPNCKWGTKTPFASIRRIVQTKPQFFKIKPGLWGLTEMRENILKRLSLDESVSPDRVEEFNHTYYQGLVVEIGNLQGYKTFVPKQDRNKKFLTRSLSEVASLDELYKFTYEDLVKRASTIDVIWFNSRKMPHAFFEIEHTTDFYNSLLKFLEFQDFRTVFCVVADAARQKEFKSKVAHVAFTPIRGLVKFIDYVTLPNYHSKVYETTLLAGKLQL